MMKQPILSIVVPVYNCEATLKRCLDSIRQQKYADFEAILINDGSTDQSGPICIGYTQADARFIYQEQSNQGPSSARNRGIALSRGEYLAFVDSDDFVHPDIYSKMVPFAVENGLDEAVCGYWFGEGEQKRSALLEESTGTVYGRDMIRERVLKKVVAKGGGYYSSMCNKLFRREIAADNGLTLPLHRSYGEDWFFNQKFLGFVQKIGYINEPLYYYVGRENSIMHQYRANLFELHLESRRYMLQNMKDWGLTGSEDLVLANTRFAFKVREAVINEWSARNPAPFRQKWNRVKQILSDPEVEGALANAKQTRGCAALKNKRCLLLMLEGSYYMSLKPWLYRKIRR